MLLEDIIRGLAHLNAEITKEDINSPKPERIMFICQMFIVKDFDIAPKSFEQFPLDAQSYLTDTGYPDSFSKSVLPIVIYNVMSSIISDFGDQADELSFSLTDLLSPTPKSTRRILRFMAEYYYFKERVSPVYAETIREFEERKKELEDDREELNMLREKCERLKSERRANERKENELRGEMAKYSKLLNQLTDETNELTYEIEKKKKANEHLKETFTSRQQELEETRNRTEQVSSELIDDPEGFRSELEGKKADIERQQTLLDKERKDHKDLLNQLELCKHSTKELNDLEVELKSVQSQASEWDEESRKLKNLETKVEDTASRAQKSEEHVASLREETLRNAEAHAEDAKNHARRVLESEEQKKLYIAELNVLKKDNAVKNEDRALKNEMHKLMNEKVELQRRFDDESRQKKDRFVLIERCFNREKDLHNKSTELFVHMTQDINCAANGELPSSQ